MTNPIQDQPDPKPNDRPAVWPFVIADMQARDQLGRERYGTPLQPFNGRDALTDLYQEILDAAVYCRQEIEERKEREPTQAEATIAGLEKELREAKQFAVDLACKLATLQAEHEAMRAHLAERVRMEENLA